MYFFFSACYNWFHLQIYNVNSEQQQQWEEAAPQQT